MSHRAFVSAGIALALLMGCSSRLPAPGAATPEFDADAYAVYSLFIDHWGLHAGARLAIDARTPSLAGSTCVEATGEHATQISEAAHAYLLSVGTRSTLENHFASKRPVHVAQPDEVAEITRARSTTLNPDVPYLGTLSAVGFSRDRQVAFVYGGYWCGDLCGAWQPALFVKEDGVWRLLPGKVRCFTMS